MRIRIVDVGVCLGTDKLASGISWKDSKVKNDLNDYSIVTLLNHWFNGLTKPYQTYMRKMTKALKRAHSLSSV